MALFTTMLIFFLAISAVIIHLQGEKIKTLEANESALMEDCLKQIDENFELAKDNLGKQVEIIVLKEQINSLIDAT